jgi:hypothetical protein
VHNEALSVVAMRVSDEDRFARENPRLQQTPTSTGPGEFKER